MDFQLNDLEHLMVVISHYFTQFGTVALAAVCVELFDVRSILSVTNVVKRIELLAVYNLQ